jgi:hypothetical protein
VSLAIHLLSAKAASAGFFITAATALIFAAYGGLEAAAAIGARTRRLAKVATTAAVRKDKILMIIDCIYVTVSIVHLLSAALRTGGANFRRFILFAIALIATDAVTCLTQVWFPLHDMYMASLFPQLLHLSVHISVASALLFLLRPEETRAYHIIDRHDMNEILEVDSEPVHLDNMLGGSQTDRL